MIKRAAAIAYQWASQIITVSMEMVLPGWRVTRLTAGLVRGTC